MARRRAWSWGHRDLRGSGQDGDRDGRGRKVCRQREDRPGIYAIVACLQALITPILVWEKGGMTSSLSHDDN